MSHVNVTVSNEAGVSCDEDSLARLAGHLMDALRVHADCELGITLVDVERMTTLHEDWMNEPGPTDVLSFPIDEITSAGPGVEPVSGILGDIVLCPAHLGPQAAAAGRTLDQELQFLTTHGLLHLIGYDHQSTEDHTIMFELQDELLAGWRAS